MLMGSVAPELLPHIAELPHNALKASVVLLPHIAELPQRAELPHIAELPPTNALGPQTPAACHIGELPQTPEASAMKYTRSVFLS